MATQTATVNGPKQDLAVEQKIQELRKLYADAPEFAKTALENALPALMSQATEAQASGAESAGRIGSRQGKVSELTVIAPFAPGGANRLRAVLRLLNGNFERGQGWHSPRHALRLPGQRHEVALRHRLRRRLGPLHRRLRDEDSRRNGRHLLCFRGLAGDSQPGRERLDRQAPDHGRRLVRRPSESDGGGDRTAEEVGKAVDEFLDKIGN